MMTLRSGYSLIAACLLYVAAVLFMLVVCLSPARAANPMICEAEGGHAVCAPLSDLQALQVKAALSKAAIAPEPEVEALQPPSPGEVVVAAAFHKVLSALIALFTLGVAGEGFLRLSELARLRIGSERKFIETDPVASAIYHGVIWLGLAIMVGLLS